MKSITEEQYDKLCNACDALLKKNTSFERKANTFLNIIREHPIFLKNYFPLFQKKKTEFLIYLIKQLLYNILHLVYNFFNSFYRHFFLREKLNIENRNYENIFISHFLNDSFIDHKSDFYFFDLPQKLSQNSSTCLILYINFTKKSINGPNNILNNREIKSLLLPKYLSPLNEIRIFWLLLKDAINLIFVKAESNFEKRIKYQAAISSISAATQFNYRLSFLTQKIVKKNNVKRIFTTYEGHPWERLIFSMVRKINNSIKCVGYQHALIFRKQHAIKRKLEKNFEPDYLLFSGKKGFNLFKKTKYLPLNNLILFGTNRIDSSKKNLPKVKSSKQNVFLILPEGDLIECIPLTKFAIQLALFYQELRFIIRFHPITNVKKVMDECPLLINGITNIELSNISFDDDLRRSEYAIYRGSTTIIKAIQYGLVPIYYEKENEISIDPLCYAQEYKTNVSAVQDLSLILRRSSDEIQIKQLKLMEHINEYFSPINYNEVIKKLIK